MIHNKLILLPLLLSLCLASCSALREIPPTPDATQIQSTLIEMTPDQIAQAMQNDQFFADYNGMTLSIRGSVAGVSQKTSDWLIELKTSSATKVLCDVGKQAPAVHAGDAITVQAFTKDAQRGDSSVILGSCLQK